MSTAPATEDRTEGLSRLQASVGTAGVVVFGVVLVLLLGVVFGRAEGSRDDGRRTGSTFDQPADLDRAGLDVTSGSFSVAAGVLTATEVPPDEPAVVLADRHA
ncbi:MAG TPA: hypothetical protein VGO60_01365, partial [Iamia sp.]|nr:hypothetical protein [Iamia sp.]